MINNTLNKRKYIVDLVIMFLASFITLIGFLITMHFMGSSGGSAISGSDGAGVSGGVLLLQTIIGSLTQFGCMGLSITIVCVLRKESFRSFGLKTDKLLLTIVLSALVFLPSLINMALTSGIQSYFPFQTVSFTKPLLASDFPTNAIGMLLVIIAWGFFEGFSYVVVADRINKLLPSKHFFINWGAIICGIVCLLLHTIINLPPATFAEGLCSFIIVYGMLIIRDYTGNAWGTVFIYVFLWNAII